MQQHSRMPKTAAISVSAFGVLNKEIFTYNHEDDSECEVRRSGRPRGYAAIANPDI
jgi:hypothetical protein